MSEACRRKWVTEEAWVFASALETADPEAAVRLAVKKLLMEAQCHLLPTDLVRLYSALGVRRVIEADMVLEGALRLAKGGEFDIVVRADRPARRKRFTVAHELGHLLFRMYSPESKSRQDAAGAHATDEEEFLCNVAAEEILMPEDFVRGALNSCSDSPLAAVLEVAEACQVSLSAVIFRIARLWHEEGAIALWRWDGDKWSLVSSCLSGSDALGRSLREVTHYRQEVLTKIWKGEEYISRPWIYLRDKKGTKRLEVQAHRVEKGSGFPVVVLYYAPPGQLLQKDGQLYLSRAEAREIACR